MPDNPLIIQSDLTVLVELRSPRYAEARDALAVFAELVKSPEHIHTYRITPLSIWNACAAGMKPKAILATLQNFARYEVPAVVTTKVTDWASRYGKLQLVRRKNKLVLELKDPKLKTLLLEEKSVRQFFTELSESNAASPAFEIYPDHRGLLKQALIKFGYPLEDIAGYREGKAFDITLRSETAREKMPFALRDYQEEAVAQYHAGGSARGGSGVIVLPCGAGKTIVGLASMAQVGARTLILTTNTTSARQWVAEILDKTNVAAEDVGEYTGNQKRICPVTVATYQILTWRESRDDDFRHLHLFNDSDWGLIIYDEVHLLPAPVFQITAGLQARRRLGLTATLVREDGREEDVFALIGPKKADVPWKVLENKGWIAQAECHEMRVSLAEDLRMPYAIAPKRNKFRIASENPAKHAIVTRLVSHHSQEQILIIGMYVDQLKALSEELEVPLITGSLSQKRRDVLFNSFRGGELRVLVVSKVANFAVDLPDAAVAIQVSGTFGSRQEEAQRLGRILRPKGGANRAWFYSLVTADTVEQDFALKRQMFLCEPGYDYQIIDTEP